MEDKKMIKVTNRSDSYAGYNIPDAPAGYERDFAPGETKEIELEEIKKLYWTVGGRRLIENYFIIGDEAIEELQLTPNYEYFYTKDDIKELLLNGSYEQLEDTIEFGPEGVLDLVKTVAVDLEIPDIRKRNLIKNKLGLDVTAAIDIIKSSEEDTVKEEKVRRAEPIKTERKAAPVSKYKNVEIKK